MDEEANAGSGPRAAEADDGGSATGGGSDEAEQPPLLPADEGLPAATPASVALAEPSLSTAEGEWLDRICPYLLSEDGAWRSTQPDPAHRCMAQDPPGTLPSAFQERFCLTDRHVRCEMYKFAQTARSETLGQEGIAVEQVRGARFRPSVRSVPVALGASDATNARSGGGSRRRPLIVAGAAFGAMGVILVLALGIMGLGSDAGGGAAIPSPSPRATDLVGADATARLTLPPIATPTPGAISPDTSPSATTPGAAGERVISYQVQEGEALIAIAETFGTSRRQILNANEGMREADPYVEPGDVIRVPVSEEMSEEEIRAQPGFVEFTE